MACSAPLALALASVVACAAGCKGDDTTAGPAKQPPRKRPGTRLTRPGPVPIDDGAFLRWLKTAQPDAPVFRVGNRVVRASVFQAVLRSLNRAFAENVHGKAPTARAAAYIKAVLDDRIVSVSLRALAEQRGLAVADKELDSWTARVRDRLRRSHVSLPAHQLAERAREAALLQKLIGPKLAPSDATLKRYFEAHAEQFAFDNAVQISELVVGVPRAASQTQRQKSRNKARALSASLAHVTTAQFVARARKLTDVTGSAALTWFPASRFPKDIRQPLLAAKLGSVVGPLPGPRGFHIFYVAQRRNHLVPPLSDVRASVLAGWRSKAIEQQRHTLYAEALRTIEVIWLL